MRRRAFAVLLLFVVGSLSVLLAAVNLRKGTIHSEEVVRLIIPPEGERQLLQQQLDDALALVESLNATLQQQQACVDVDEDSRQEALMMGVLSSTLRKNTRLVKCFESPLTAATFSLLEDSLKNRTYRLEVLPTPLGEWRECLTEWMPGSWQAQANAVLQRKGAAASALPLYYTAGSNGTAFQVYKCTGVPWGMGSSTRLLARTFVASMRDDIVLCTTYDRGWSYYDPDECSDTPPGLASECYFLEQAACHGGQSVETMKKWCNSIDFWSLPGTKRAIETQAFARDWMVRLNGRAWLMAMEKFRALELPAEYMAIQARFGDKHTEMDEGETLSTEDYFFHACATHKAYGFTDVFLSSDSQLFIDEIQRKTSIQVIIHKRAESCQVPTLSYYWNKDEARHQGYRANKFLAPGARSIFNTTVDLFVDILALRQSTFVIGTRSSNVGRMVAELRDLDGSYPFLSLDDQFYKLS